jgi:hypothetical protein
MGSTLNEFYLPGVGRVRGRAPTLDEYRLAIAVLSGRLGRDELPAEYRAQRIAALERIIRLKGAATNGNEDGDKLDGSHMESDPGMHTGE